MKSENITDSDPRSRLRRYDDACGAAHALELVGDRWALLIIREMMFGPRRFGDLRSGLPGISANVLSQRLGELEAAGIAVHRRLPPPAASQVYELTPWGLESEPIFQVLGRWAARSPSHDPTLPLSAASLMLSLRTMLDAKKAGSLEARIGMRLGDDAFRIRLAAGEITAERGEPDGADLVLSGAAPVLAGAIYGGRPLSELEAAGLLAVKGDRALAERFVTLFPLPAKVGAADP